MLRCLSRCSCIFNHNKPLQQRNREILYNDVELVFSSRRSTDYRSLICRESHFYTSKTQRTRLNRNKHEQNHDLVTNTTLWPSFVSLHCTSIQLVFPWSGYSGWRSGLLRTSTSSPSLDLWSILSRPQSRRGRPSFCQGHF